MSDLHALLGKTDIYLIDLVLSENSPLNLPVFDAGCGRGRNLHIFRQAGYELYAMDQDAEAIAGVRTLDDGPDVDSRIKVGDICDTGFADDMFGLVICNAVLHFVDDEEHFRRMTTELMRVLAPDGVLFCRLASSIGLEAKIVPSEGRKDARWHRLPDGSDRFLVDLEFLTRETARLGADLVSPIKTINVQNLRCMTNWVLRKRAGNGPRA